MRPNSQPALTPSGEMWDGGWWTGGGITNHITNQTHFYALYRTHTCPFTSTRTRLRTRLRTHKHTHTHTHTHAHTHTRVLDPGSDASPQLTCDANREIRRTP